MLRASRLYFSAFLAALVLVSMLLTTNVKACEEPPQTLLALYMGSDLIVLARYESETAPVKTNEDEYGYSLETQRQLVFTKMYKGQTELKSVSISHADYVPKQTQENPEPEEEIHEGEDYFNVSKIKMGGEYLFFLTQNKETGAYNVTDYVSGVRETGKNLSSLEKNLSELEQIASAKENQYELLTEWLVKSIEDRETREDAISDLSQSFYNLNYEEEDEKLKGKGPFITTEEGYGIYTVGVARHLTASQKERVAAVLYPMLQEAWFAEEAQYANYAISGVLGGINKSRLAVYTFNSMQSVAKTDFERKRIIREFLTETVNEEAFSNLSYEIAELEGKIEEAKAIKTPLGRKQLRDLNLAKELKVKEFEKRFKFLLGRNFAPVENKVS